MNAFTRRGGQPRRRRVAAIATTGFVAALATLAFASPASAADSTADPNNIVQNSNFATPQTYYTDFPAGSTQIPHWTVGGDSVDIEQYFGSPAGDPATTQTLDLTGFDVGSVSQTLATTAGVTYSGSFELASNTGNGPATKTGTLTVPGKVISFSHDNTLNWTEVPFSFTAASSSSSITFASTTVPNLQGGPIITDVIVDPPAAPGTPLANPAIAAGGFAFLGALALGFVFLRRRRATA